MTLIDYPSQRGDAPRAPAIVVTIGRVAEITGLTPRAIRYYEERGLVEPSRDRIGQRGFNSAMCERLSLIALLRSCGVSLFEVADVLRDLDSGARNILTSRLPKLLARRRDALKHQIDAVDRILKTLAPAEDVAC